MKKYKSKSALKHFILTAIFAAMCQHGAAQTTEEVATGLGNPKDIHIISTNLYVAEQSGRKISKIDLAMEEVFTQFTETGADADATFIHPTGLASISNDLYVGIGIRLNKILKMDITDTPSSSFVDIVSNIGFVNLSDIVLDGTTLYVSSEVFDKIVKIDDVTAVSPTVSDFITGITSPRGLLINGDNLYITSGGPTGKLLKINTTADTPVAVDVLTGLNQPTYIVLEGDNLYISESGTGKILKIDITEETPTKTEVLTGLVSPEGLAIYNGYLYIAQGGTADNIVKYPVSPTVRPGSFTLSTQEEINGILDGNFIGFAEDLIIKETTPGNITSLAGLANITSIGRNLQILGNTSLVSLEGLEGLVTLGGVQIGTKDGNDSDGNAALIDFCAISSFVTGNMPQIAAAAYFVANNGYNPTYAQFGDAATCTTTKAGNLILGDQAAINGVASIFTRIAGNLIIKETAPGNITSLTGLANIISIGGNLEIVGNTLLTNLEGLEDLVVLEGKLYIGITAAGVSNANAALVNYCAISNLVTGGASAEIIETDVPATNKYFVGNNGYNPTYAQLGDAATCSTTMPGDLVLGDQAAINAALATSFTSIQTDLKIEETTTGSITSLLGLSKITSIGGNLEIIGTTALVNLVGLSNITTLGGKLYIGITAADGTTADANTALVNFCAISGLVTGDSPQITNASATNEYFVENNEYNPSYAGLAIGSAATTDGGVDGCREFGAVVSTNTFSKDRYRLFPNPVKDILFIKSESEITSISISNLSGQIVLKGNSGSINVRYLSKGIYFAKIVSGEKVVVEKFIKL